MEEALGFRPLYRQVFDHLVNQIASGVWKGSEALPSEKALAAKLGVSQGTVRKALDAMAAERLIERRQGKGTYVAQYDEELALFRFFRLTHPDGTRAVPEPGMEAVGRRAASEVEAAKLDIEPGSEIVEIERTRLIKAEPMVFERIVLPVALFPDIDTIGPLPNALYTLYQSAYGVKILQADEEVRADLAGPEDRRTLGLKPGDPVLQIDRVARGIGGDPAEFRVSRCNTGDLTYAVTLR